ncbi:DAO-domain-containing protein [Teratosphaeria nubilosa]|uniref:DAO-domain-containing protein n=1 Tax=Teratosphaeria nubilosa TaxID=161662 RepID=A0A6G1KXH1_9PEZI|nr:DAO-domain-containing protein [Teratosphaeria nubilosa]
MAPHANADVETSLAECTLSTTDQKARHRSLPVGNSSLSFWHKTARAFEHLNANCDQSIPENAKYCIIGSGLAGCLTAWKLVESGVPGHEILILEAREAVSGASGRNAGHVRPDAFRGFTAYARIHGEEQAKKIIENEKLVFETLSDFVAKHNVPCDFHSTTTFDVCLTDEFAAYEAESLEKYRSAGGDVSHVKAYHGVEAKERTKVASARSAYEWPAGSSHPAKLAQWLLNRSIAKGVQLWTHCPVTRVVEHPDHAQSQSRWDVKTPRGGVAAETVIHCTNAYASYLLPELETFITPNRAQAHSIVPSKSLSGANTIKSTMSLRYSLRHFYSLIQRQSDGTIIFGISRSNPGFSKETEAGLVTFDDTTYHPEVADVSIREFQHIFPDAPKTQRRHGEGGDHYWTGIIGMTPDSVPLVGPVTGKEGQWICAGFNGHGMARIFTCAPGLVKLIHGESWSSTGLPECFQYSSERLARVAEEQIKGVW